MFTISAFFMVVSVIVGVVGLSWIPEMTAIAHSIFMMALFFFALGLVTTAIRNFKEIFQTHKSAR